MFRRRFSSFTVLLVIFLLLGMLVLGGCDTSDPPVDDDENGVPDTPDTPDPEPEFKTLVVSLDAPAPNLDPAVNRSREGASIFGAVSGVLSELLPEGGFGLDLVAEPIKRLDSLTYEIKLRQDVTFHNGDPMTADDIVFSWERVGKVGGMEGNTSARRSLSGPIDYLEKVDEFTVILKLERTEGLLQDNRWHQVHIVQKKQYEEEGPEGFMNHPIGVGPFKWVQGDLTEEVVLERNENYYGGPQGWPVQANRVPAVDRVIFRVVREPTTRVAALLGGDVHIIQNIPLDSVSLLEANPDTQVVATAGSIMNNIQFNVNRPPFDDARVRHAVAYAIDYDLLVEQLLLGYSKPLYGHVLIDMAPGQPGYGHFDGFKSPFHYNPEKARALLEEAGYPNGFSTVFDTQHLLGDYAQAIAQMLSDVGIETSVRIWDNPVLNQQFAAGVRDIGMFRRGNPLQFSHIVQHDVGTGESANRSGYSNPDLDALFLQAMSMEEDTPARSAILKEAFQIIWDDLPILYIDNPQQVDAVRSNVKNYRASITGRLYLQHVDIE